MKYCINGGNVIRLLSLSAKLLKFEIQKCGQILCAHKPYFLMPGHKCHFSGFEGLFTFEGSLNVSYNTTLLVFIPTNVYTCTYSMHKVTF